MPLLETEPCPRLLSRGVRQRIGRRRALDNRANEVLHALNWMSGHGDGDGVCRAPGAVARVHREIHERVLKAVHSWPAPDREVSQEEAARALLRAESIYDKAHMTVTPYEEGKVSLPVSARDARYADSIGGARARDLLERFIERHRRSPEEIDELNQTFGAIKPYMDRRLESSPRLYRRLVRQLDQKGMIHWTRSPKSFISLFFVKKRSGALRMITDARPTNRLFRPPPGDQL